MPVRRPGAHRRHPIPTPDIYIAYTSEDRLVAEAMQAALESRGLLCWGSDQGVVSAQGASVEVLEALHTARILVLIHSAHSATTPEVRDVLNRGAIEELEIVAFQIDDADVSPWTLLWLQEATWVDARTPPMADHLSVLADDLAHRLEELDRPAEPVGPLVFLSAKTEDLHHARECYEFLTGRGIRAFLSSESLPELGASDYREAIDEALEEARHMVVVTSSRDNVTSSWVKAEWGLFVNELRSDRKSGNLLTIIADGMRIEDLPPSLRYYEVLALGPDTYERLLRYLEP